MKEIVLPQLVKLGLRTLDAGDRRRVRSWFKRLANWDDDESVRSRSHRLDLDWDPPAYVLNTDSDWRIVFTIQEDRITIINFATEQAILASVGRVPETE
jgi:hypothetical protein